MRIAGEPVQLMMSAFTTQMDPDRVRERWLIELEAGMLCEADYGASLAITGPSDRFVTLQRVVFVERARTFRWEDSPMPLVVLVTDDGDWEMRRDQIVWMGNHPTEQRGSIIRWPVNEPAVTEGRATRAAFTRWTNVKPE